MPSDNIRRCHVAHDLLGDGKDAEGAAGQVEHVEPERRVVELEPSLQNSSPPSECEKQLGQQPW